MGKNNDQRNAKSETATSATDTAKPVIDAAGEAVPGTGTVPTGDTALATSVPTEMAVEGDVYDGPTMEEYAQDLPHLAAKLAKMKKVTPEDLGLVYDDLSPEETLLLDEYRSRLIGDGDTDGESVGISFMTKVPLLKVYNNSEDAGRPGGMPLGGVYAQHGNALTCTVDDIKTAGLPLTFDAAVIGYYPWRIFWPGEEKDTNPKVRLFPTGYPQDRQGPICQSMDRQKGVYYGDCAKCPYSPGRTRGQDMGCKDFLTLFLMLPDMTVARMNVSGTSLKTTDAIKAKTDQWSRRYEYIFELGSAKKVSQDGKMRWYVLTADVKRTPTQKLGVPTSKGARSVGSTYARIIQTEWYYPSLAATYQQMAQEKVKRETGGSSSATNGSAPDQGSDAAKALKDLQAESEANNV